MVKALVSGFYGRGNLGDEAILAGLKILLGERVELIPLSFSPPDTYHLHQLRACPRWNVGDILSFLEKSDFLVSGGGGLFQDWSLLTPFYYGAIPLLSTLKRKKYIILGQSIGPLKYFISQKWTELIYRFSSWNGVRDIKSWCWLRERGIETNLMADLAFHLLKENFTKAEKRKGIGILLRYWSYSKLDYLEIIKDFFSEASEVEYSAFREKEKERYQKEFSPFFFSDDYKDMLKWIAEKELIVTMRLHGIIFAILTKTPFIAICYDEKMINFLETYQMSQFGIKIDELSSNELKKKIDLWEREIEKIDLVYQRIKEMVISDRKTIDRVIDGLIKG